MKPTLREEKRLWEKGYRYVVGLDEAGIGPLAGPVVAAAVAVATNSKLKTLNPKQIQNPKFEIQNLRDSKKLTPKARDKFYKILTTHPAIRWGVGIVSEKVIDKINIKNAAELAMGKALQHLERKIRRKADFLIIDGSRIRNPQLTTYNLQFIIKADEKVFSCAAASIIAKVTRDRIMLRLHKKYPWYGFDKHKGYPTKCHRARLAKYGPCEIHRKSFGCRRLVLQTK